MTTQTRDYQSALRAIESAPSLEELEHYGQLACRLAHGEEDVFQLSAVFEKARRRLCFQVAGPEVITALPPVGIHRKKGVMNCGLNCIVQLLANAPETLRTIALGSSKTARELSSLMQLYTQSQQAELSIAIGLDPHNLRNVEGGNLVETGHQEAIDVVDPIDNILEALGLETTYNLLIDRPEEVLDTQEGSDVFLANYQQFPVPMKHGTRDLTGAIIHTSGHWISMVKKNGQWYLIDDSQVEEMTNSQAQTYAQDARLLHYRTERTFSKASWTWTDAAYFTASAVWSAVTLPFSYLLRK